MTPAPTRVLFPADRDDRKAREPTVKVEVMRQILGMLLAGVVSYLATVYGLQERIKVLEVRLDYLQQTLTEVNSELRVIRRQHERIMSARGIQP